MRSRTPISLFPFLSVLLSTMGVLSFLAVTFLLFANPQSQKQPNSPIVEINWTGAPTHVRPVLMEARGTELVVLNVGGVPLQSFKLLQLQEEVATIKLLVREGMESMEGAPNDTQLWVFLKNNIRNDAALKGSFASMINDLEISNLSGSGRKSQVERYPILLIYPDGIPVYSLASYLIETTSRLALGLEPMLENWSLPYQNLELGAQPQPRTQDGALGGALDGALGGALDGALDGALELAAAKKRHPGSGTQPSSLP